MTAARMTVMATMRMTPITGDTARFSAMWRDSRIMLGDRNVVRFVIPDASRYETSCIKSDGIHTFQASLETAVRCRRHCFSGVISSSGFTDTGGRTDEKRHQNRHQNRSPVCPIFI
jgi:hypothetical protein